MSNPLKTRMYGHEVSLKDLIELVGGDTSSASSVAGFKLIRLGVLEYQGDLYRIGGFCLIMVNPADISLVNGLPNEELKEKDSWPYFANTCWDIKDSADIIKLDTFVGSLFDIVIDPEVGPGPRAIRDMTGHNGNIVPRATGRMDTARMMSHANKGGHLID